MLTRLLIGVALAAISALQTPRAEANPDDFLAALDEYGIDLTVLMGQGIGEPQVVQLGRNICSDLHHGISAAAEANRIFREMPNITDKQSGNLVSAAQFTMCPNTLS